MADRSDEVAEIGNLFEGRLPEEVRVDALDYLNFGEWGLALAVLCDQLVEYGVLLTRSEFERLKSMANIMYPDDSALMHLERQVREL